ncbi:MAG: LamG domain-containing protein [Candidatus Micrarchaeaceae archaeon]
MRAQLALEFLIVYGFVLIAFIFIFSAIASQRAIISNQDIYSNLYIEAQNLAAMISQVGSENVGYSLSLPVQSQIGPVPYTLSVSKQGEVIAYANIGAQRFQAVAYSSIHNIFSSPTFLSSNSAYLIPTVNGSIYLEKGLNGVCIDISCVQGNSSSALNVSLSVSSSWALDMNGESSVSVSISPPSPPHPLFSTAGTISFWISKKYSASCMNVLKLSLSNGYSLNAYTSSCFNYPGGLTIYFNNPSNTNIGQVVVNVGNGVFSNVVIEFSDSQAFVYVNGNSTPTIISLSSSLGTFSFSSFEIYPFQGEISNVQLYASLIAYQSIASLYNTGISSQPLRGSLIMWLPLRGDVLDYSGNGNAVSLSGPALFSQVYEIKAKVFGPLGPVPHDLVGFSTSLGYFNTSMPSRYYSSYTNSSGVAIAFLDSVGSGNGNAVVSVVPFPTPQYESSLIYWSPGDLNSIADLSQYQNPSSSYYTIPSHAKEVFNSTGSDYISTNAPIGFSSPLSAVAWIYPTSYSYNYGNRDGIIMQDGWALAINSSGHLVLYSCNSNPVSSLHLSLQSIPLDQWSQVGVVGSSGTYSVYVDGMLAGSFSAQSTITNFMVSGPDQFNCAGDQGFIGYISNVQLYKSALNYSQMYSLYSSGLSSMPLNSNLYLWWPLLGNATDYSGNGNNGYMPYGLFALSPSYKDRNPSYFFSSYFNGVNSYANTSLKMNVTPSGWTESAWVNISGLSTGWCGSGHSNVVLTDRGSGQGQSLTLGTTPYSTNGFGFFFGYDTNNVGDFASTYPSYQYNKWYFLTGVYNGTGLKIYVDGILEGIYTTTSYPGNTCSSGKLPSLFSSPFNWTIGYEQAWNSYFYGKILDVQVYASPLSSQQVYELYEEGIGGIPIQNARLLAWWPLNTNTSSSYSAYSIYPVNVGLLPSLSFSPNPYSGIGNLGISFNGYSSYAVSNVIVPSSITVVSWFVPSSLSTAILQKQGSFGMKIGVNGAAPGEFAGYVWGSNGVCSSYPFSLVKGEPYMLSFTYNSSLIAEYVNGINYCNIPYSSSIPSSSYPLSFGGPQDTDGYVNGTIANVEIFSSSLSSSDIEQIYSAGVPNSKVIILPLYGIS